MVRSGSCMSLQELQHLVNDSRKKTTHKYLLRELYRRELEVGSWSIR